MKAWEGLEADERIAELGGTLVDTATRATSLREALIRVSAASRTAQDEAGQADRTMAESEARAVVREMVPLVTALEALNQQLDGFRDRLGPSPAPPAAAGVGGRAGPHGACALGLAVLWRCEAARQSIAARSAHTRASSRPGTHRLRSGSRTPPFFGVVRWNGASTRSGVGSSTVLRWPSSSGAVSSR
jgi:hypothetical protein